MSNPMLLKLNALSDVEFENLTYSLCVAVGYQNVVWRTPGSDGGRDIEAISQRADITGQYITERWHIECKRYKASISWPIVYEKISHAEALGVDFLLISVSSNVSPMCEDRITKWNDNRHLKVRIWRGYQLVELLKIHTDVAHRYGIIERPAYDTNPFSGLISQLLDCIHATGGAFEIGKSIDVPLNAARWLSLLIEQRSRDIHIYQEPIFFTNDLDFKEDWINIESVDVFFGFDSVGLMTIASYTLFLTQGSVVKFRRDSDFLICSVIGGRWPLSSREFEKLQKIALWANFSVAPSNEFDLVLKGK